MEAWGTSTAGSNGAAVGLSYPVNFDITEMDVRVQATALYHTGSGYTASYSTSVQPYNAGKNMHIYIRDANGEVPPSGVAISWYAVGRWK
ncbi:hypothetical protein H8S37_04785 [Mediterraneibacter sp. NSJ-55]|uniref:Uncharacterized protein n=1 Tax=Mediterraneibacter hominis TaxID=2763054 RepID=A0A923RP98_9FIRM|nr:hypothetical protein [Mediterraneibacter hominis]MBC5688245.1 hypothetical protein [Mediterraneibacter hominis]